MSVYEEYVTAHRPEIQLEDGLLDEAFVKNAVHLAENDPKRSGVFFSDFLARYFRQAALGTCRDVGERLADPSYDHPTHHRSMLISAAEAYRHCHKLRELHTSLQAVMFHPPAYLETLLMMLQQSYEEHAVLAAWTLRRVRSLDNARRSDAGAMVANDEKLE